MIPEMEPVRRDPAWGYSDLALWIVLFFFVALLTYVPLRPFVKPEIMAAFLAQFLAYAIWLPAIAWLIRRKAGRSFFNAIRWNAEGAKPVLSCVLGPALILIAIGFSQVLKFPDAPSMVDRVLQKGPLLPFAILGIVVFGPLAEEIFFRGLIQPVFSRTAGPLSGALGTAILFGMLHIESEERWQRSIVIAIVGVALGLWRNYTGSVLACALMHITYNATMIAMYFGAQRFKF